MRSRFRVEPPAPYSLALTAQRYARFPDPVDRFDGQTYRRLLPAGRGAVLVTVEQAGGADDPSLQVTVEGAAASSKGAEAAARKLVGGALGAAADLRPFYRVARLDPLLAPLIRRFRGLHIAGYPTLWEALVTAVLAQQVNLAFAFALRSDLSLAFGRKARLRGETFTSFPTPKRVARAGEAGLEGFRLSKNKISALARLATAFASGELTEDEVALLPDEAAIERLSSLKGVGTWTAETALLRGLGRPDAYPAGDLSVVKYLAETLFEHGRRGTETEMRTYAEKWRPWRGLALVYAWAELARRERAGESQRKRRMK